MKLVTRFRKNGVEYRIGSVGLADAIASAKAYALQSRDYAIACRDTVVATQELVGGDEIHPFDATIAYHAGDFVLHAEEGSTDKHLYKALVDNGPGQWQDANWRQTSFYAMLCSILQYETVRVRLQYANSEAIANKTVTMIVDNTTVTQTTNSDGYAYFSVPFGSTYTISVPAITGYVTPTSQSRVANASDRYMSFTYKVYTVGLSVIKKNGDEVDMSVWNVADNDQAEVLKLTTTAGNCAIAVHNVPGTQKKWANATSLFPSVYTTTSSSQAAADMDGITNSDNMAADLVTLGLSSEALAYCRAAYVTINGSPIYGYLPSAGQLVTLVNNIARINEALRELGGNELGITAGFWWSSTQYHATNAWYLYNGGLDNYGKTNGGTVIPFFAF